MNGYLLVVTCLAALAGGLAITANDPPRSVLDFTMKSIAGEDTPLRQFAGKVVLLVNTASKCGLTPQYKALEALYKRYRDRGLVILGFPANDFLAQEPGTDKEIQEFCLINYGVSFPMFSKISVRGRAIHPLYAYLTGKATNPAFAGKIAWNFTKFLVDRKGNVMARFEPRTVPDDPQVIAAIEKALAET